MGADPVPRGNQQTRKRSERRLLQRGDLVRRRLDALLGLLDLRRQALAQALRLLDLVLVLVELRRAPPRIQIRVLSIL